MSSSDAEVELPQNLCQENNSCTSSDTAIVEDNKKKSTNNESDVELNNCNSKEISSEISNNLKTKLEKNCVEDNESYSTNNVPIVGEAIEEAVMIVKGEGLGQECDTGNPDETDTQNETSKSEDIKKPKLWSIETICSSSKEIKEEVISVPTTGFFFGDDSVPCFSNVSNGEKSNLSEKKLEVDLLKENDEESKNSKKLYEVDSSSVNNVDKESNPKNTEEFSAKQNSKQSIFNIKVHEKEIQITEHNVNEAYAKSESIEKNDTFKTNACESTSVDTHNKSQKLQLSSASLNINENDQSLNIDEIDKCGANNTDFLDNTIKEHKINIVKEEIKFTPVVDDSANQQQTNNAISDTDMDKKTVKQQKSSVLLENKNTELQIENKKEKTELQIVNKKENTELQVENKNKNTKLQIENDQQLKAEIVNHTIEINEHGLDDDLQINKQSTSGTNESGKVDQIGDCCKKNENESLIITKDLCTDIDEQKKVDVKEKQSKIDKTIVPNVDEPGVLTDTKILTNVCSIIDKNKESKVSLLVEDNEMDKAEQGSNDVNEQIEIADDLKLNASNSNDNLDQHTECNKLKSVDCSSIDQIVTKDASQCLLTHQQIDFDQNDKKPKKTSHDIRNIISDCVVNEQLTDIPDENQQITKMNTENSLVNNLLQEENKSVVNADCQKVSNKKHSLDKILQKLDQTKEITKINKLEKENSEVFKIKDKLEPCRNVDNEEGNIIMEKSKTNIKELKTESLDSLNSTTAVKEQPTEVSEINKNVILTSSSSVQKQSEIVDVIDEKLSAISTKQFKESNIKQENVQVNCVENKLVVEDIKPSEVKKEKNQTIMTKNKTNVCFEEKLNSKELKSDTCSNFNLNKSTLETSVETNEECTDEISEKGKIKV